MFSTSNSSNATAVVAMMMMMMMMMTTEAAAMPKGGGQSKHSARTHRKSSDGATVQTVPLQLDPNVVVPPRTMRPLQNASISPWTYNVSHDDSLFPAVQSEARCLLKGCLDWDGREDLSLESKPIMQQVLLLRRVKSSSSGAGPEALPGYHYRLETRLIAVGCTCVRPVVRHQD